MFKKMLWIGQFRMVAVALCATFAMASVASASVIVDGWTVVDNESVDDALGTFAVNGAWIGPIDDAAAFNANWIFTDNQFRTATWTFLGLAPGNYEVALTWVADTNRSADAPFSVNAGAAIDLNQQVAPSDFTLNDGGGNVSFDVLGTFAPAGGQIAVALGGAASGFRVADAVAVKLIPVPEPASLVFLGIGGCLMMLRRRQA